MQLNRKVKALAAAIAMAAGSQAANAAVVAFDDTTGNSSFMFFAFDAASGKSFVQGLNKRMDDIVLAPTTTQNFSVTGLNAFFGNANSAEWAVVAADNVGSVFKFFREVTTSASNSGIAAQSATNAKNAAASFHSFIVAADKGLLAGTPVTTTSSADTAFAGQGAWANNWGNNLPFDTTALTNGSVLTAYLVDSANAATGIKPAVITQLSTWKLNLTNDSLVYAPSAVPVPAAVWMLGAGLMSLVGVARRWS